MLNFDINEFRVLSSQQRPATMRLSKGFIIFSKTIAHQLKNPKYIRIMVHDTKRLIIIKPCSCDDEDSITFAKKPAPDIVRIRRSGVYKEISRMLVGFDSNSDESVCIDGDYYEDENLFLFNARKFYYGRKELYMSGLDNVLPDSLSGCFGERTKLSD